jgi:DNA-binding transcriptional LysR family regulator
VDIQNLRAFLLVAETGSFSLAAEKLHLTQPAVSKRIALLEEQLGADLFDRIGRNTSLTEAGTALLPHARAVQRELEAARQSVRDLSGAVAGQLRLATSHHIGLHRLPGAQRIQRAFQAVHRHWLHGLRQAYELIMQGKVDWPSCPGAGQRASVVTRPVWRIAGFHGGAASPAGAPA